MSTLHALTMGDLPAPAGVPLRKGAYR
jgi:hypothetical protein